MSKKQNEKNTMKEGNEAIRERVNQAKNLEELEADPGLEDLDMSILLDDRYTDEEVAMILWGGDD